MLRAKHEANSNHQMYAERDEQVLARVRSWTPPPPTIRTMCFHEKPFCQ